MQSPTNWLKEIRGNAAWDAIKWLWGAGGAAVTLALQWIGGWVRHHQDLTASLITAIGLAFFVTVSLVVHRLPKIPKGALAAISPVPGNASAGNHASVDLRGEILELHIHKQDDILSFPTRTTIIVKLQLVNHGAQETAIVRAALIAAIGSEALSCDPAPIPESWRIQTRKISSMAGVFELYGPIEQLLVSDKHICRRGIPVIGWLAFEHYATENIEFPNARFLIRFQDALGGMHDVVRLPMIYRKVAELVKS